MRRRRRRWEGDEKDQEKEDRKDEEDKEDEVEEEGKQRRRNATCVMYVHTHTHTSVLLPSLAASTKLNHGLMLRSRQKSRPSHGTYTARTWSPGNLVNCGVLPPPPLPPWPPFLPRPWSCHPLPAPLPAPLLLLLLPPCHILERLGGGMCECQQLEHEV